MTSMRQLIEAAESKSGAWGLVENPKGGKDVAHWFPMGRSGSSACSYVKPEVPRVVLADFEDLTSRLYDESAQLCPRCKAKHPEKWPKWVE